MVLGQNVVERRAEGERAYIQIVDLDEETVDPALWGRNFPRQYDGYLRTVDTTRTKYGGSEAFSRLEADPRLLDIFAGYAFAIEYREERGHAASLVDQEVSERVTKAEQPGSCLQCHASMTLPYYERGVRAGAEPADGRPLTSEARLAAVRRGFEEICALPYQEARELVEHPVACIDCHDPETMDLRITRPAFLDGIAKLAASDEDLPHFPSIGAWREGDREEPYDPNSDASRQEMRALVCGQCHVEYYFRGDRKLVTYPWDNGIHGEDIERYYDEVEWADWEHALSGAAVLKAQHPEFEVWNTGVHARSGVMCADCHMPYERDGALKTSVHHVRSPLLDARLACGSCHPYDGDELVARAERIQDRTREMLDRAEAATVELIRAIEAAARDGATDGQLAEPRALQRRAQWLTDFVNAENSLGFHSAQEQARSLARAVDFARQGIAETLRVQAAL
jgi:nitrite reductase (cytochrome c-552)